MRFSVMNRMGHNRKKNPYFEQLAGELYIFAQLNYLA